MGHRRKIVDESVSVSAKLDIGTCKRFDAAALKLRITRGGLLAVLVEAFLESPDCAKCLSDAKKELGQRLIRYRE